MENVENQKCRRQVLAILAACGAIFSVGLNIAWPSPCLKPLMDEYDITNRTGSYITISSPFGNVVGSGFGLFLLQSIGSKDAILLSIISQTIFWFVIAFCPPPWYFYIIGRLGTGFGESIGNIAIPTYISEIACPKMKRILLCFMPIILLFGNIVVNNVGLRVSVTTTSYTCVAIVFIWTFFNFIFPSTPYHFIKKNNYEKAVKSLKFYLGKEEVETELDICIEVMEKQKLETNSMVHLFTIRANRHALFMLMILRIAHLFSGYPATIIYTHQLFIRAHINIPTDLAVSIFNVCHLIFSLIGVYLSLHYKRKKFLIISFIGSFVFQLSVTFYFYFDELSLIEVDDYRLFALLGICGYICFYSMGMHIVPNLLFLDLFNDSIKCKACCLLNMLQGAIFFTISKGFQEVTDACGQFIMFLIYTVAAFFGIFFVHFCVPETHGKTFEELHSMFQENGFRFILSSSNRY